ncbi:MAG TPA: hypothetical protein VND64_14495 [Pirellulales bacterium]|nr:hypothetical protein [Pirellulales bacterium]
MSRIVRSATSSTTVNEATGLSVRSGTRESSDKFRTLGILTNSATHCGRAIAIVLFLRLLASPAYAQRLDSNVTPHGLAAREHAHLTTRELVISVLDVQLRQLRENGLESLPLYHDMSVMHDNIDGLIEAEMREAVETLCTAQQAAPAEREQAFAEARRLVRQSVFNLALERHGLERRLKIAGLVAKIQRLMNTLENSAGRPELDETAERRQAGMRRLGSLLERVKAAEALVVADRETTLERVREIAARQAKLRADTAEGELTDASADALVKRQTGIHQSLIELERPLRHNPSAEVFSKQANDAAFAASGQLFELAGAEALAEQDRVSANLAKIGEQLLTAAKLVVVDKSAADYTQLADELSRIVAALGPEVESLEGPPDELSEESPAERTTPGGNAPTAGRIRDFSSEPWFVRLPAEVRGAIRAQARRPAPRGYEERLRRYFEGLE